MKRNLLVAIAILVPVFLVAQSISPVKLSPPDTTGGLSVMKALSLRASERNFDTTSLSLQTVSNLMWAANGINRPDEGKRTAPSAMNAQDIDVYLFLKSGTYVYHAPLHQLQPIVSGDNRNLFSRKPDESLPPAICLLVSDVSRFKTGSDSLKLVWAAMDAGIVSQNIALYCASAGLASRPRASMNQQKIRELLLLKSTQFPMLNIPVAIKND